MIRERKHVLSVLTATTGFAPERARYARPVMILSAITALVLLVACANFTNLMLARAARRRREFVIRLALGGGRWRLIRQSAVECVALALAAGLLGLLFASWATELVLKQFAVMILPIELSLEIDSRILTFAGACVAVAAAFGLVPHIRQVRLAASTSSIHQAAHAGDRAYGRATTGRVVLIVQLAMCAILLIGAGLLLRTVANLRSQELGFDRNVLLVSVSPRPAGYGEQASAMRLQRVRERLAAVPGIQAVGVSGPALMDVTNYWIDGSQRLSTDRGVVLPGARWTVAAIGPDFFKAVGIALLRGREFDDRDARPESTAVIINRSLATFLFGDDDPLGRQLRVHARSPMLSVIGVVSDAKQTSPRDRALGVIYAPLHGFGRVVLAVRTAGSANDAVPVYSIEAARYPQRVIDVRAFGNRTRCCASRQGTICA